MKHSIAAEWCALILFITKQLNSLIYSRLIQYPANRSQCGAATGKDYGLVVESFYTSLIEEALEGKYRTPHNPIHTKNNNLC
jgi:hypothetical protein